MSTPSSPLPATDWYPKPSGKPGSPPQRSSNPTVVIGVIAATVALAVSGCFGGKHFGTSASSSPEDQIRAVVRAETDAWNKSNFSYNPDYECKAAQKWDRKLKAEARKVRAEAGTASASVANIQVTGDHATADVTWKFAKAPDDPQSATSQFVKEGGSWKDCTRPDSSDNDPDEN